MREKRIQHYEGKSVRSCTQFKVLSSASAFITFQRKYASDSLVKLINEPEVVIGNAQFLKQGNSSTVVKVTSGAGEWVIKRYNIKSFWHWLQRCFRPSRAWVSWKNAYRLELLGIATPLPLAMRENRYGPLRREAYLVTEYTPGESLQNWMLQHGDCSVPQWLDTAIERIFSIFWDSRVSHGDMKATNLLVTDDRQLQVIDLDAMAHHRPGKKFKKAFAKDLQRFMDNWQGGTWQHFADLLSPLAQQAGCVLKNNRI
jgi:tRNA A-37 threonylcarbamoyl transferase component Bud32